MPGTPALAEVLDLAVSDDTSCGAGGISGTGVERPVPDLPQLTAQPSAAPATYREHDELQVGDVIVDWWVTDAGELHAATVDGLARALAWASGQWSRRFEIAAALERPESAHALRSRAALRPLSRRASAPMIRRRRRTVITRPSSPSTTPATQVQIHQLRPLVLQGVARHQGDDQRNRPQHCADLHGAHRVDVERLDVAIGALLVLWHPGDDRPRPEV